MNVFKLSLATVALASLTSITPAHAAKTFDFASAYPENALISEAVVSFVDNVKEKSDNELVITAHFGGALGYDSRAQYEAAEQGAVDLAQYPLDNLLGVDPMYELHSLPFIAPSVGESYELYKAALPYHEEAFNKANQTILFSAPFTPQGIWSKDPIRKTSDLKGVKLRTVEAVSTAVFDEVGASPIQLTWGDTLPALSTSAISGLVTSDESGINAQVWDFGVKNFTPLGYSLGVGVTTMNRDAFESLTDEEQALLREQGQVVEEIAWQRAVERIAENQAKLESEGGQFVTDIDDSLMAELKAAGQPFIDKWKEKVGPEISEAIFDEYESTKAQ